MKELINNHRDKKGFLRKATATAGLLVALAGCEAPVTEGEIYQKTQIPQHTTETVLFLPDVALPWKQTHPERWEVKIAQCPTEEPRQADRIEKECKTAAVSIPKKMYDELRVGEYYRIPPPKSSPLFQDKRIPGKLGWIEKE